MKYYFIIEINGTSSFKIKIAEVYVIPKQTYFVFIVFLIKNIH